MFIVMESSTLLRIKDFSCCFDTLKCYFIVKILIMALILFYQALRDPSILSMQGINVTMISAKDQQTIPGEGEILI